MQDLNPFSTPQDPYATAQAQAAQRDYAKALLYGDKAKGGGQFPVVQSWSQGVSNMVNALMGGLALNDSQKRDQSRVRDTSAPPGTVPTVPAPPTGGNGPSFSEGPPSEGPEKSDGGLDRQANAIASVESKGSGDYSAVGPQTHTGDRAYGKYQVMGTNVPKWTQEVLGKPMSPEEFLKNPQAQDAVFRTKFAQGGDNDTDRASTWFTGKPYAQGASRSDGYINGAQYVDRFNKAMGSPGQATAFAGPDAPNSNPAVSAISSALRGGTQVAANVGGKPAGGGPLPQPNGQGIFVDPKLVPQRPPISEQQMRAILNSDFDSAQKAQMLEQYRQQGQPVEVPYPGGKVVIDPHNPTRQQFIPDLQKSTTKLGDMEKSTYGTIGPSGTAPGAQFNPINPAPVPVAPPGPRSEVAPPVAPATNPPPAPTVAPGAPNINVGAATPPASQAAPEATAKPVQVASADPAQAFAAAAASGANPAATPPATPATPLTKLSANDEALKQFIGPEMWDAYTQKKAYEQGQALDLKKAESKIEVDKDAQTKSADFATKKYDTLSTAAQAARKQMPNLDLALAMMNDPNMHNGMLSGAQDIWSRFKAAALGESYANAPNEAFDKIMASTVLGGIKDVGGGQIRNAEIQLLGKANANRTNTDASNRAVLEVSRRALQTTDHLDQIGQAYASGDAVVDPITGKEMLPANIKNGEIEPRHGLDVGYDKLARKFVVEHPSFTPEEIKNYSAIFDSGRDGTAAPQKAEGGKGDKGADVALPVEAIAHLKADKDPNAAANFEKVFGPGSAARALGTK